MRYLLIPLAMLVVGCCPSRIADGDQFGNCDVPNLIALLGDATSGSGSIRSAVHDETARAEYIANSGAWDQLEIRWLLVLDEIQVKASVGPVADKARLLQLSIEQARAVPELRMISAGVMLAALEELEGI